MLGKPKFKRDDKVQFTFQDKIIVGKVYIIDEYGTFEDDSDVSYDIMVDEENCLYKHVREDYIKKAQKLFEIF